MTGGHDDADDVRQPPAPPTSTSEMRGGRMNTVGVPTEKSKDFAGSSKRLFRRLGPERPKAYMVLALAVASVALVVSGPKILGHATNLIFEGLVRQSRGGTGIDFAALHTTLWFAVGLYLLGYLLAYLQAFVLAGVVQRTMYRLRADVETKLHAMPLSYLDRQARGDLLSRVTNDIDNVAQSMQQSLSQLLQGVLTIAGTIGMMLWISWQLAIVAVVTVPLSLLLMKKINRAYKTTFIFSTHDKRVIARADRLVRIEDGHIALLGVRSHTKWSFARHRPPEVSANQNQQASPPAEASAAAGEERHAE